MLVYAWNAQMGLMFANGGPKTTEGSLMAANGVNLSLARQDDNDKLQAALVEFATDLSKGNAQPSKGATFVAIMGDGSATFLAGLNEALKRLGPEYQAKIVGSSGYSRGEDKFMGPANWRDNPQAAMGGEIGNRHPPAHVSPNVFHRLSEGVRDRRTASGSATIKNSRLTHGS